MKKNSLVIGQWIFSLALYTLPLAAVAQKPPATVPAPSLEALQKAIDGSPDSLALHEAYLKASGFAKWSSPEDPAFISQYETWIKKYPRSAAVPYALGHAFSNRESPRAKPYLLEAIKIDPNFDKAYFDLWMDAERWGDFKKASAFIKKASDIKPDNPDYAFYYASSFSKGHDKKLHEKLSLEVASRFPKHERGAQALYWIAARNQDVSQKIKYYELLKNKFQLSDAEYGWASSGMSSYFYLLLGRDPAGALKLARTLEAAGKSGDAKKQWAKQVALANRVTAVRRLIAQKKSTEALAELDSVKVPSWSPAGTPVLLLRASALNAGGKTDAAYHKLLQAYVRSPEKAVEKDLLQYGQLLHKNKAQVKTEVAYSRDTAARAATDFSLNQYFVKEKASLASFKGKAVLLTYWFPGCGPCRGEFPHFQNVVNRFSKSDLVYVGINIMPGQNDYVLPFMKSSGYTFIPLEDYEGRNKGNLDNRDLAPMNFLLDQEGRIIFKDFRADESNEDVLYEMIASVIEKGKK